MTVMTTPQVAVRSRIASAPPVELLPKSATRLREALGDLQRVRRQHAAAAAVVKEARAALPKAQAADTENAVAAARAGKDLGPPVNATRAAEAFAEAERRLNAQRLAVESVSGDVARAAVGELDLIREAISAELVVLDDRALRMLNEIVGVMQAAAELRAVLAFTVGMATRGSAGYTPGAAADAVVEPVRTRVTQDRLRDLASAR